MLIHIKECFQKLSVTPLLYILTAYLVFNTGIFSDDFSMSQGNMGYTYLAATPVMLIFVSIFYNLIASEQYFLFEIVKTIYVLISLFMVVRFFSYFYDRKSAIIISFAFVFFPVHESTNFFFIGQYLFWSAALYMYAFVHGIQKNYRTATLLAFMGSFISYGSTPFAIGMALLCYLKNDRKAALALLFPQLLYIIYYILITKLVGIGTNRIPEHTSLSQLGKQFLLQIGTAIDAIAGPSMWIKVYYSIISISSLSLVIGIITISAIFLRYNHTNKGVNRNLVISFATVFLLSLLMFSVTGNYPQIAFNLGNRVTIYGCLLLSYLLFSIRNKYIVTYILVPTLVIAILGLSDHWKKWNQHQQLVVANIRENKQLKAIPKSTTIFVSGNQYSKLGSLSHIEFLSERFVVRSLFRHLLDNKELTFRTLDDYTTYENGLIKNTKYQSSDAINNTIYIYDSERNKILILNDDEINDYLESLPKNKRHWIQLLGDNFIKDIILYLMPRLKYAF